MMIAMSPFKGGIKAEDMTMNKKTVFDYVPVYWKAVNIPLRLLRARLRLVQQLECKFEWAAEERRRICMRQNIPYLARLGEKSPDKDYEILSSNALRYHNERILLDLRIVGLEHEVSKLTKGNVPGYKFDGAVAELR